MKYWLVIVQYYVSDGPLDQYVAAFVGMLAKSGVTVEQIRVDLRVATPQEPGREQYPFLDISGYLEGMRQAPRGAPVVVMNDTYFVKHPWRSYSKSLATVLKVLASIERPCAAGAVFPTTSLLLVDSENPSRRHVCTFLVALNDAGRAMLEDLGTELPPPGTEQVRQWLLSVRSQHRALDQIMELHFSPEPNPWQWQGMQLQPSDRLVQRKAVTVAAEYLLSRHLLQRGGLVLPINAGTRQWVAEQLERLWLRLQSRWNRARR